MIFPAEDSGSGEPRPTALYAAAASVATANLWTSINGFAAARVYTTVTEEYEAATTAAGVIDAGPIIRYSARGPDAARALGRATSAPVAGLTPGESARGLMLDEAGGVIDKIEVARLSSDLYLLSCSRRHARRFQIAARGFSAEIAEITGAVAALAIVGPAARETAAAAGLDVESDTLARQGRVRGVETSIRPIHFGAQEGVEIIYPYDEALTLWERLRRARRPAPVGLDALEIVRIEGGTPRPGLDFTPAGERRIAGARRTPDEIGLPHLAPANSGWFNGRRALVGSPGIARALVVLAADAGAVAPGAAVYARKAVVGRVTSAAYSPRLKRALAFADIGPEAFGKPLEIAAPGDGEERIAATLYETAESRLAGAFRAAARAATDSRR